ncbi:hypothetical protein EON79_07440 [bacterium]|nr:MAG: hypothetical protein EON79_07440 [bacterium]
MAKLWLAAIFGAATLGSFYVWLHLPNAFARPLRVQYVGQTIDQVPIDIEVAGDYRVVWEIVKESSEDLPNPPQPPLLARVTRDGTSIGKAYKNSMWSADEVGFSSLSFRAERGDAVFLSLRPHPDLKRFRRRVAFLIVERIPFDYALGFVRGGFWGGLTLLLALATCGLTLTGWGNRRNLAQRSQPV